MDDERIEEIKERSKRLAEEGERVEPSEEEEDRDRDLEQDA